MGQSLLDSTQVLKSAHDDATASLKTRSVTSLVPAPWDHLSMTLSPATTETYVFRQGGLTGTVIATIVVVYTDAARSDISSVSKL